MKEFLGRVLLAISLLASIQTACPAAQQPIPMPTIAHQAFLTPEDLMAAFVECIAKADFDGAMELFNYREKSVKFNFLAMAERLDSIQPIFMAPGRSEPFREINRAQIKADAGRQIKFLVYSLLLPDKFSPLFAFRPYKAEEGIEKDAAEFVTALNTKRLSGLTLTRIELAKPEQQLSEKSIEMIEGIKTIYRFTEYRDYMVYYDFHGVSYVGGAVLVKYDELWTIDSLNSVLGGTGILGNLVKENFEPMLQLKLKK